MPTGKALSKSYRSGSATARPASASNAWRPASQPSPYSEIPNAFGLKATVTSSQARKVVPEKSDVSDIHRYYTQVAKSRKETEKDLMTMRNRIAHLQHREFEARKTAQQLENKVTALRRVKMDKNDFDDRRKQMVVDLSRERTRRTQSMRDKERNRKKAFALYVEETERIKRIQALQQKERQREDEHYRTLAETRRLERAKQSKDAVKERQSQFRIRQERQRLYDMARTEEQREMKAFLEKSRAENAAEELRQLEMEEELLLDRLTDTNNYTHATMLELEHEYTGAPIV